VLSYDYWTRRFGRDPKVVGQTLRIGNTVYEIVGIGPAGFTGTEPGTITDIFIPTMMNEGVVRPDSSWFRTFVLLRPAINSDVIIDHVRAPVQAFNEDRAQAMTGQMSKSRIDDFLNQKLLLEPAGSGVSGTQNDYRTALIALAVVAALVLLIASFNVGNLMLAQSSARAREMALRVSIGAGRMRLFQMLLTEGVLLALAASALGSAIAGWSTPFIVGLISIPDKPTRLILPADWRVLGFGIGLTFAVLLLFGLMPAIRASSVQPVAALKGAGDRRSRHVMFALIGTQLAFCYLVLFVAGLFTVTSNRLTSQATGFSSDRILALETVAQTPQPPAVWEQVRQHLGLVPGIEMAALSGFGSPLLGGSSWNGFVIVNGGQPSQDLAYFLEASPEWLDAMKIPLIAGHNFRPSDTFPGVAIVNESFAKRYFPGEDPIGKRFQKTQPGNPLLQIVGVVRDARYRDMREPITPTAYVPFVSVSADGAPLKRRTGTIIVRTVSSNPLAMASVLRRETAGARSEFRVTNVRSQAEINASHTVRERLLAGLGLFFAGVALLLAGVGLYGVLHYSVLQRRREIGIRIALGADAGNVAWQVTRQTLIVVILGSFTGIACGAALGKYVASLLYQVKASDGGMLTLPYLTILVLSLLAAFPAVLHAVRIDPANTLRAD
jgi:predicted permease